MTHDLGLLLLRAVMAGFMLFGHGLPKVLAYAEKSATFRDPLGVGSEVSFALAVFAEFVCAALVLAGAFTRYALVPLIITMAVAGLIVHAPDPFAKKELALMFAAGYTALLLLGPGRFSVDGVRKGNKA